jgi:hypothetical protein
MKHLSFIFICALILQPQSLLAAQSTNPVAGKVVFSSGNNTAISADGEQRAIKQGDAVRAGDKLQTDNGQMQVRFTDNGFASLKPKSQLIIKEYTFNGEEDGKEKAVFSLLKGSVRAVTGFIGKHNNKAYKYETPVATIGIRGTAFVLNFCNQDCFGADGSLLTDGLYVNNGEGRVYVENNEGMIDLVRGQFAFVQDVNSEPEQITQPPAMGEMFREETESYDFDRRAGETLVENILVDNSIVDGGLGELKSLAFTFFDGSLGSVPKNFSTLIDSSSSITTGNSGEVSRFYFFDVNAPDAMVGFDSRSSGLIDGRSGQDTIYDASWGIWSGNFRYYNDDTGIDIAGDPIYLAYMGFSNPTDPGRLPTEGSARFNVELGSRANGAINPSTGELSNFFSADIGVNWVTGEFNQFDLETRYDSATLDLSMISPTLVTASTVTLTGEYNNGTPMTAFGDATFNFANNASVIGGSFHADAGGSHVALGTFLVGDEATGFSISNERSGSTVNLRSASCFLAISI